MPRTSMKFLNDKIKNFKNENILIMGVAYKGDIGDLRSSPTLDLIEFLKKKNSTVTVQDPFVEEKS